MKAVIQRVSKAQVKVDKKVVGKIGPGYAILLGIHRSDNRLNADKLAQKVINLRIMADQNQKMNLCLKDSRGEALIISQFTLYADTDNRRPGFTQAAPPAKAKQLYDYFIQRVKQAGVKTATGQFGAYMDITLHNDGPVTILLTT